MKIEALYNRIVDYDFISFDLFDTLIKRDVDKPTDVFRLVERKWQEISGENISFFKERIEAEQKIRKEKGNSEYSLDEIYENSSFPEKDREKLKQLEIKTELEVIRINKPIFELYNKCLDDKKKVFIVSNMYLPLSIIKQILCQNGIFGYKAIYLSSEQGVKKRDGKLYKRMLTIENIKPANVLHIGDSFINDAIIPMLLGIHVQPIISSKECIYRRKLEKQTWEDKALYAFLNNRLNKYDNRASKIGYEILGPIILGYCVWLHDQLADTKAVTWFVARDMYLFYHAYKALYNDANIQYVYMSRKSLIPSLVQATGKLSKVGEAMPRGKYSYNQIYKILSEKDCDLNRSWDKSEKYNIRELDQYDDLKPLMEDKCLQEKMHIKSILANRYLESNGLFSDEGLNFVDVGWHGTIQYILQEIRGEKGINGFYLGTMDNISERLSLGNYKSYLFDENSNCHFSSGLFLFETMILAPYGTTVGYKKVQNNIKPVIKEENVVSEYINNLQKGAMDFINDYKNSILNEIINFSEKAICQGFENLLLFPQQEELLGLGEIVYDDYGEKKLAAPRSIGFYLVHPLSFFRDFKFSPWRIGFLYRLFKIRLPYAKVYIFLRNIRGKNT